MAQRTGMAAVGAAALAAVAMSGCGGGGERVPAERPADPGEAEVPTEVYGTNHELLHVKSAIGPDGLSVPNMTMRAGGIIEWINRDDRTHRLHSTRGSAVTFRTPPIKPGGQFHMTVDDRGRTFYRSSAGGRSYRGVLDSY